MPANRLLPAYVSRTVPGSRHRFQSTCRASSRKSLYLYMHCPLGQVFDSSPRLGRLRRASDRRTKDILKKSPPSLSSPLWENERGNIGARHKLETTRGRFEGRLARLVGQCPFYRATRRVAVAAIAAARLRRTSICKYLGRNQGLETGVAQVASADLGASGKCAGRLHLGA